jgi:hypothetical protein
VARQLKPCGTFAAYLRHKRRSESVDDACAMAARDQWNNRSPTTRQGSLQTARLAVTPEPLVVAGEVDDARQNLRIIQTAMSDAPTRELAGLSKRRQELVALIHRLEDTGRVGVSVFEQLAKRRANRRPDSTH